ncbi:hypothetical protein LINPERHAP1_LOCUS30738 [Linum perenne]
MDETASSQTFRTTPFKWLTLRDCSVTPMCDCGLPSKLLPVEPKAAGDYTPFKYYIGCPKKVGRCRMSMWCKMQERGAMEPSGVVVLDEMVMVHQRQEERIEELKEEIARLKVELAKLMAYYND